MFRPGPGPLIGAGVIGALGYLGYDAYQAYQDREEFRSARQNSADLPATAPRTEEKVDSLFNEKAYLFGAAYVGQIVLTYYIWDQLGMANHPVQPYLRNGSRGQAAIGFQWRIPIGRREDPIHLGPISSQKQPGRSAFPLVGECAVRALMETSPSCAAAEK